MALVVEDGTGLDDAESYISVADADAYHAGLGNTAWAELDDEDKEIALRKASSYMVQFYRQRWRGTRVSATQALDWPREDAVVDNFELDEDVVPAPVAKACADLALRTLTADLAPDVERAVKREKIGPIETEYEESSPQTPSYRSVDLLLAPFLKGPLTMAVRA